MIISICKPDFDKRVSEFNQAVIVLEKAKKEDRPTAAIIVPVIKFHDFYGVWFFGELKGVIQNIAKDRFGVDLGKQMHVYVDIEPKKISTGIHDIAVYDHTCVLYRWIAQGYDRGLVTLATDEEGNRQAVLFFNSETWSWVL